MGSDIEEVINVMRQIFRDAVEDLEAVIMNVELGLDKLDKIAEQMKHDKDVMSKLKK